MKVESNLRRKKPIPMSLTPIQLLEIMNKINRIDYTYKWDLTAFACFLYLTGARISEALDIRYKNLRIEQNFIAVDIKTLKSKIYPLRKIPIAPVKSDEPFFQIFKTFLDNNTYDDDDYIFPFQSRVLVWKKFNKVVIKDLLQLNSQEKKWERRDLKLHPHYLRHCRLSHLVSEFDFNEFELMKFAGWTSIKPCIFYIKLDYRDLLKKMIKPNVVSEYAQRYLGKNV